MIVLDASVLIKLFKDEDDSPLARNVVNHILQRKQPLLAPTIILYEALSSALHVDHPFDGVAELFDRLKMLGLQVEEPNRAELNLAEEIATTQAPGGGFPTLFDSIYHAMAIERGGTFVTADIRHVEKTRHLGHVLSLPEWRPEAAGRSRQP
jgi:predicted nucleic acid-binding protein